MNGGVLCCASRWCSTAIPAHSSHRAGAVLGGCAPGMWPHWVTPVVGSCHPVPGNTCPMALCGLWHNSGSSLQYTVLSMTLLSILISLSHRNPAGSSLWQLVLCEETHHRDQHWTLRAHSTESLTATKPLWWGARSEVMNTSFPGRLISSGTFCQSSFTALHFFVGCRCTPCDTWAWGVLSWLGFSSVSDVTTDPTDLITHKTKEISRDQDIS